jgi:hypothetical protein
MTRQLEPLENGNPADVFADDHGPHLWFATEFDRRRSLCSRIADREGQFSSRRPFCFANDW